MNDLSFEFRGVEFNNPIWIASSPLTGNYNLIEKAIERGAGSIVYRSVGNFKRNCKENCRECGNRKITLYDSLTLGKMIESTTTKDSESCDRITIEESNRITRKIKNKYPDYPVIVSFAPSTIDEFNSVHAIEADLIEINTRNYKRSFERPLPLYTYAKNQFPQINPNLPFAMGVHRGLNKDMKDTIKKQQELFLKDQKRVIRDFKKLLKEINRPKLLKLVAPPELLIEEQLKLDVDGFTAIDSMKMGKFSGNENLAIYSWGKSSMSGSSSVAEFSRYAIKKIREEKPEKFVSASGGIYNINDVRDRLGVGADSIQLCSSLYFYGIDQIKRIINDLKTEERKSADAEKTYELGIEHPSLPVVIKNVFKN